MCVMNMQEYLLAGWILHLEQMTLSITLCSIILTTCMSMGLILIALQSSQIRAMLTSGNTAKFQEVPQHSPG